MGALEQIMQMRGQGSSDQEIMNTLQQQGVSPKEINDAFGQSQIKNAVSNPPTPENMQPSTEQPPQNEDYAPQTQEAYAPQQEYTPETQEYYPQEGYEDYATSGADTMIEISEQVFSEKTKKIQQQIDPLNEFKTIAETQINSISERLKRIEITIDKLQLAILDKIGSYGDNLETIKKEMSMMQDSFGKVVNKAVRGSTHITPNQTNKT